MIFSAFHQVVSLGVCAWIHFSLRTPGFLLLVHSAGIDRILCTVRPESHMAVTSKSPSSSGAKNMMIMHIIARTILEIWWGWGELEESRKGLVRMERSWMGHNSSQHFLGSVHTWHTMPTHPSVALGEPVSLRESCRFIFLLSGISQGEATSGNGRTSYACFWVSPQWLAQQKEELIVGLLWFPGGTSFGNPEILMRAQPWLPSMAVVTDAGVFSGPRDSLTSAALRLFNPLTFGS